MTHQFKLLLGRKLLIHIKLAARSSIHVCMLPSWIWHALARTLATSQRANCVSAWVLQLKLLFHHGLLSRREKAVHCVRHAAEAASERALGQSTDHLLAGRHEKLRLLPRRAQKLGSGRRSSAGSCLKERGCRRIAALKGQARSGGCSACSSIRSCKAAKQGGHDDRL